MDSSRDHHKDESTLRDDEFQQSSGICYYRRGEGVPFQWEKQPGTPKNPAKEDANIINPPLSPPPSFQSLGLSKPCFDYNEPQQSKRLKVWLYKKIKKPLKSFGKSHQNSHDSFNNSSSSSSWSSSSTDSFASNTKERDKSARITRDFMDDLTSMDNEEANLGNTKMQKSDETLFFNKILSRMSSVDQSSHSYYRSTEGIPFKWEMQPGTPIHTPQNEVIPPPSPPPIVQSLALPKPCIPHDQEDQANKTTSTWERIKRMIKTTDHQKELSFRLQQSSHCGDTVLSSSSSSSSSLKKKVLPLSKFRRDVLGGKFCFNPWKIKTNVASSNSSRRM